MITSIEIENFKGIGERIQLDLKPITLLFGPNAQGKAVSFTPCFMPAKSSSVGISMRTAHSAGVLSSIWEDSVVLFTGGIYQDLSASDSLWISRTSDSLGLRYFRKAQLRAHSSCQLQPSRPGRFHRDRDRME